jgi:3-dehydroquinate synthetase/predicted NBD/HSP70 family sugar kinase
MLNNYAETTTVSNHETEHYRRSIVVNRQNHFSIQLSPRLEADGISLVAEQLGLRSGLLITTPTVARLYGKTLLERLTHVDIKLPIFVLACSEATKLISGVEEICAQAYQHGLNRESFLIALGGGVCSDLVTMAASWIRRGIATIRLPTTLVGQVDAAIGIKGAVNFQGKKNALGCFYPPEATFVDPGFLRSLPARHLRSGFAEILKVALVCDSELFDLSERIGPSVIATRFECTSPDTMRLLWIAITRMLEQLEINFYEDQSYQRLVDFGHIFSPLLESRSGYSISHGEAVAIDMAYCSVLSYEIGMLSKDDLDRILLCFQRLGLPFTSKLLDDNLVDCALVESKAHRGGKVNLLLPIRIGAAVFLAEGQEPRQRELRCALRELWERANKATHASPVRHEAKLRELCATIEKPCVVFDIGGTYVRCGRYMLATGTPGNVAREETPSHYKLRGFSTNELYRLLLETMHEMARKVLGSMRPEQICVAFPGPIDPDGRVVAAPTLWPSAPDDPINITADLQRLWPTATIAVLNDMVAAGYRYCQERGRDTFCIVTVSSGIGNKIFLEGKPYLGPLNRGGEIGHIEMDPSPDASICECGGRGHLGGIASGRGVLEHVRRRVLAAPEAFHKSLISSVAPNPDNITNKHIVDAFRQMDPFIVECIRFTARPLATALAAIHGSLGIERFIIIGGFAIALGDLYRRQLIDLTRACCWSLGQDWDNMIELGEADDLSGLIGAGRYISDFASEPSATKGDSSNQFRAGGKSPHGVLICS